VTRPLLLDLFCGAGGAAIRDRFWSHVDRLAALLALVVALAPGTVEATGRGDRGPDVVEVQP
jgi:hypothetical protein